MWLRRNVQISFINRPSSKEIGGFAFVVLPVTLNADNSEDHGLTAHVTSATRSRVTTGRHELAP